MPKNKSKKITSGIYDKNEISLIDIIETIKKNQNAVKIGSILTFTGIVRSFSREGKEVKGIKIDAYEELANQSINKICNDLKEKYGLIELILTHFKGEFNLSEDLVHVVVASSHREEGFKALREAVERYKSEIAVWKREDFSDGTSKWIH